MYGRTTSLKTNYMIDNKEVQAYLKKAMSGQVKDKDGNTINAKDWKNAFNKKGSVDNKQEYLELLLSYIRNETKFNGLTEKYASTINGQIDRLKGNWETLKADLLGIDANGTGMAKPGKITVFSSIKKGLDGLDQWLDSDKGKALLNDIGESLGTAINSISDAFLYLLNNIDWKEVGNDIKELGKDIADFIKKLEDDGTLKQLLELAPELIKKSINNEVIKKETDVNVGKNITQGHWWDAGMEAITGKVHQITNYMGHSDLNIPYENNNKSWLQKGWDKLWEKDDSQTEDNIMLSDINASAVLEKTKLTDDQKNTIQGMIQGDNQTTYNVTIGTIQADSFDDIVASIKKAQNNQ